MTDDNTNLQVQFGFFDFYDFCRGFCFGGSFTQELLDEVEQLEFCRTGGGGSLLSTVIATSLRLFRVGLLFGVLALSSSSSELLSNLTSAPALTSFMSEIIFREL
jgi:hypothetical protein